MSNAIQVDFVMETHLQNAFDELADLITNRTVTYKEVRARLLIVYGSEYAGWFEDWWDEYE